MIRASRSFRLPATVGLFAAASLLIQGCIGGDPAESPSSTGPCASCAPAGPAYFTPEQELHVRALEEMGFARENIRPHPGGFVIGGDIFIASEDILREAALAKQSQRTVAARVAQDRVGQIRVQVEPSLAGWIALVDQAIAHWNSIGTRVRMVRVTTTPDIRLWSDADPLAPASHRNLSANVCGMGAWPASNLPGPHISFNLDNSVMAGADADRLRTIIHEFGHNIGIAHTNEAGGALLAGTPETDAISLMNGGQCGSANRTLSPWDNMATLMMYPRPWRNLGLPGGGARDLGAASNGATFAIGSNVIPNSSNGYGIWRWNGSSWTSFPGAGLHIDADPAGNPWVIGGDGQPYQYSASAWTKRTLSMAPAKDIGIGSTGAVFAIGSNTVPNGGNGFGIWQWNGSSWVAFPGAGIRIDVDNAGNPWVLGGDKQPYQYNGSGWTKQALPTGVTAQDIGISASGSVYAVSNLDLAGAKRIYRFVGPGWAPMEAAGKVITAGPSDLPWTVAGNNSVWSY